MFSPSTELTLSASSFLLRKASKNKKLNAFRLLTYKFRLYKRSAFIHYRRNRAQLGGATIGI